MVRSSIRKNFRGKSVWVALYAIYLVFILLSVYAFIAEDSVDDITKDMDEKYDYNLVFDRDGKSTHYDVIRYDNSKPGKITLTYWTQQNKLEIKQVSNIRSLKIDVDSMFEDEVEDVFKRKESEIRTMDMDYWYEAGEGIFTIEFNIAVGEPLETLTFTEFPTPRSVLVDHHDIKDEEWWGGLNYTTSGNNITITNIPTGETTVFMYFKDANQLPIPAFTTNPSQYAGVYEEILFNGGSSYDPDSDGKITQWLWDFGDDNFGSGKSTTHNYTKPGNYTVRLTVRDNADPYGEAWIEKTLTVAFDAEDDFDDDGLRDIWEWNNFDSLDEDADDDYDSDGATNKEEHDAGTDPTDLASKPPKKGEGEEPVGADLTVMIVVVTVVIIVLLVVVIFVLRSKKAKKEKEIEDERDDEAIAAMEAKIERAKKLGLPTKQLQRLLEEAKGGEPLSVEPIEDKKEKPPIKRKPPMKGKSPVKDKPTNKGRSSGKGRSRGKL